MKRFLLSAVLLCAVGPLAFAGDVPTADVVSPPPPATQSEPTVVERPTSTSQESTTSQELLDTFVVSIVSLLMR